MATILSLTTGQVYLASGANVVAANGTNAVPSYSFAGSSFDGFYWTSIGHVQYASNGTDTIDFGNGITLLATAQLGWTATIPTSALDTILQRDGAPNTIAQVNGNNDQHWRQYGINGGYWQSSSISELLTLSIAGTTTDTTANLLPANAVIQGVIARVTTTITTATNWSLGDATIATRFSAANSTMTAGTTQVGTKMADQTGTSGPIQTAAAKLRVTTTGTPGAGVIRITVFYQTFIPQTS